MQCIQYTYIYYITMFAGIMLRVMNIVDEIYGLKSNIVIWVQFKMMLDDNHTNKLHTHTHTHANAGDSKKVIKLSVNWMDCIFGSLLSWEYYRVSLYTCAFVIMEEMYTANIS
jgi:hypothetical protein